MMISKKAQRSHKSKEQSSKITTCSTETNLEESKDKEPESKINSKIAMIQFVFFRSFHFDRYYVPSSPRPPEKPPDDDDIYFDIEPDTGVFTKVVDDISDNSTRELYVHVPNVLPTLPTLSPMFDTLLLFSFENDDKVFNPGILASNEEKSPHLLSHRGFKAFQVISDFSESPMMIYEGNIPILDVLFLHFYPP
ncbi:hypothetical protein Tco_0073147 [Tanacetum coccineum]